METATTAVQQYTRHPHRRVFIDDMLTGDFAILPVEDCIVRMTPEGLVRDCALDRWPTDLPILVRIRDVVDCQDLMRASRGLS